MPADEIYARVKADFERLERTAAPRGEWLQLSVRLLEAMMKCQQILIELQKSLMGHARGTTDPAAHNAVRQESKDVIQILDQLSALHERIKTKL